MINENSLKQIKSKIAIECDDESQAQLIYNSILLEFETAPNYRSTMTLDIDKDQLIINIYANDSTSFRASLNSAIKWIKLSLEINLNITKNKI